MQNDGYPYFKCFPSDFLNGMQRMTSDERNVYVSLIFMMYDDRGPLKLIPKTLAMACNVTTSKFNKALSALVEAEKLTLEDGFIFNNRVEKELISAKKLKKIRSENGSKGGQVSAEKRNKNNEDDENLVKQKGKQNPSIPESIVQNTPIVPKGTPEEMMAIWNESTPSLPTIKRLNDARRRTCRKRFEEDFDCSLDKFRDFCLRVEQSNFLTGENDRKWLADFDWCLKPANLLKIEEGRYDPRDKVIPLKIEAPNDWSGALDSFEELNAWPAKWGPAPNEPGCLCPPDILAAHGYGRASMEGKI